MKYISLIIFTLAATLLTACNERPSTNAQSDMKASNTPISGYSPVNGLNMYYEIYGSTQAREDQKPLVLVHGGGSTIQSSFGRVIPLFAKSRQVIAVEMQAHGRTNDRDSPSSFEQDADDLATLLKNLDIDQADFFGFSNGATTTLQVVIRHPELVNKIVLGSPLAKRNGVPDFFWGFMEQGTLDNMPAVLKEAYLEVAPDPSGLQTMHDRDAKRMVNFKDIPDEQITAIKASALIIIGDKDIITPEHAIELSRQITNSQLAIIPGGHGDYMGEVMSLKSDTQERDFVVPMIEKFLDRK